MQAEERSTAKWHAEQFIGFYVLVQAYSGHACDTIPKHYPCCTQVLKRRKKLDILGHLDIFSTTKLLKTLKSANIAMGFILQKMATYFQTIFLFKLSPKTHLYINNTFSALSCSVCFQPNCFSVEYIAKRGIWTPPWDRLLLSAEQKQFSNWWEMALLALC